MGIGEEKRVGMSRRDRDLGHDNAAGGLGAQRFALYRFKASIRVSGTCAIFLVV